ncbi:MAG: 4Fe-4S binding protein, partial [Clostridia bacterium]|nr:4Fe-4S binding protein [Clostridia bacterium]
NTGTWRSRRPVLDKEKCNSCLRCFIYCPEGSISVQDGKMDGFDYYHCKGCGICARECNIGAISMSEEVTGGVRPNK